MSTGDTINRKEPSGKRRRASIACMSCRRRKIRCDTAKPHCGNCNRADIECIYPPEGRKKIQRMDIETNKDPETSKRLSRVEKMLKLLLEKEGISDHTRDDDNGGSSDESDTISDIESGDEDLKTVSRDDSADDDPRDVLRLNQRRAPVVMKFGEFEPVIASSYSFTLSLLSPKSMRWLCSRIGCPQLGENAEILLMRLWKKKSEQLTHLGGMNEELSPLDPNLIRMGREMRGKVKSEVFNLLLEQDDLEKIDKMCNPHNDLNRIVEDSPYSIYYAAHALLATSFGHNLGFDMSNYSKEYLEEQNKNAFNICMRKVALMTWYPTTFLLVRLLVFVAYVLARGAAVSQIRTVLSVIISRALSLGLHRPESGLYLSHEERQKRSLVWTLIHELDVKMSSVMSMVPMWTETDNYSEYLRAENPHGDMRAMLENLGLNRIYLEIHAKLFSAKARKMSVKQLLLTVVKLDEKLTNWRKSLPLSFQQFAKLMKFTNQGSSNFSPETPLNDGNSSTNGISPNVSAEGIGMDTDICSAWLRSSSIVCYYNMRMLLYSIPAFSPSSLSVFDDDHEGVPPKLQNSIDIIGDCANSCLNYAFMAGKLYNLEFLSTISTNAFSALFLKQVRNSHHPTNQQDLLNVLHHIDNFEAIARGHPEFRGILKLWRLFADTLKQLNEKEPEKGIKSEIPEANSSQKNNTLHVPISDAPPVAIPVPATSVTNVAPPSASPPSVPSNPPPPIHPSVSHMNNFPMQGPPPLINAPVVGNPMSSHTSSPGPQYPVVQYPNGYMSPYMRPPSGPQTPQYQPPPMVVQGYPYNMPSPTSQWPQNHTITQNHQLDYKQQPIAPVPQTMNSPMNDSMHHAQNYNDNPALNSNGSTSGELWDTFYSMSSTGMDDFVNMPLQGDTPDGTTVGDCTIC